ncbi:MAG: amidase [Acidimicrobiales bacterium]|jgi:amidase|nr:amidase [Acidimicrobiales bacterium]
MSDHSYSTTLETAASIASREVSSRELLEAALNRVDRLDGPINAVVALDPERALAAADQADQAVVRGDELGPLHGVPITIKDSFQTEGLITTSGAPELADFVPDKDADPVARYKAAGAIVYGKTNLPIWAGDLQSYNKVYGTTANPYDIECTPGGSSGGSGAALAAGYTPLELGSDIGGSIRIPCHWSGVCGHKPSYGVVSALGQIPGMPGTLSQADIAVAGPMARDVDDLELALDLLAGPDEWNQVAYSLALPPARHANIADFRVAVWIDEEAAPVSAEYRNLLLRAAAAFEEAGAKVDYEARPGFTFEKAVDTFRHLLSAAEAGSWTLSEIEEQAASNDEPQGELGIWYASMRHREWLSWHERRLQQRNRWREFFNSFDVVLLPVTLTEAIRHDHSSPFTGRTIQVDEQQRPYTDQLKWMGLTGVSWLPATVVPIGQIDSKPVGVQIAGPFLEDRTTLAAGRFLQQALGGFQRPSDF